MGSPVKMIKNQKYKYRFPPSRLRHTMKLLVCIPSGVNKIQGFNNLAVILVILFNMLPYSNNLHSTFFPSGISNCVNGRIFNPSEALSKDIGLCLIEENNQMVCSEL